MTRSSRYARRDDGDTTYDSMPERAHHVEEKEGHICCYCCCDVRRAVMIMDILMILMVVIGALTLISGAQIVEQVAAIADDDEVKQGAALLQNFPIGLFVISTSIQLVCYGFGVYGALKYRPAFVMIALFAYLAYTVLSLTAGSFGGMIFGIVFAYPHWYLYDEMKAGVMSPETYPYERYSMCCV